MSLVADRLYQKLRESQERERMNRIVIEELLRDRERVHKDGLMDYRFDGKDIPLPRICLEVLYELLKKYNAVAYLDLQMKSGKMMRLSLD